MKKKLLLLGALPLSATMFFGGPAAHACGDGANRAEGETAQEVPLIGSTVYAHGDSTTTPPEGYVGSDGGSQGYVQVGGEDGSTNVEAKGGEDSPVSAPVGNDGASVGTDGVCGAP